jgi:hypothetical protein
VKNLSNKTEILPPEEQPEESTAEIRLVPGKDPTKIELTTPGKVKSEMGRIYRAALRGKITVETGERLVRGYLTPILKATEIEQEFNLAMDDPEADTPALTGLTITGPEPALAEGAPARRLDGPDKSTTRTRKEDQ